MARSKIEGANEPLAERLRAHIRRAGPISFYEWMRAALYDPTDGYYCRADIIRQGRTGDYRTAPESSPLFPATFAGYFARLFSELGSPVSWTIFEAGAGSGKFAHGVLSSLSLRHPEVFAATRYVIDEVGSAAMARAATRLSRFEEQIRFCALAEVDQPVDAGVVFSNELIDAFPVHRVIFRDGKLRELYVDLNQDAFVWTEGDPNRNVADYVGRTGLQPGQPQIVEINLDAERFVSHAASLMQKGFVITVDYGRDRSDLLGPPYHEGTLRAFYRHQLVDDVFARPGEQDLTTTIDWTQIVEAGERAGLPAIRHQRLDKFLLQEGLLEELERSAAQAQDDAEVLHLRASAREMIMPHGLAAAFQVLVQKKN